MFRGRSELARGTKEVWRVHANVFRVPSEVLSRASEVLSRCHAAMHTPSCRARALSGELDEIQQFLATVGVMVERHQLRLVDEDLPDEGRHASI